MWVCCQIGAREHYAVPRALQQRGLLQELITDLWIRAAGRFHPDLSSARVTAPNVSALTFEVRSSLSRETGWNLIKKRNDWFQRWAVDQLSRRDHDAHSIFAYSYAAKDIFKFARARGWRTVLGQIDPGPAEEWIVAGLNANHGWSPAPREYWKNWRSECEFADQIVVNSNWSRAALLSEGIDEKKIRVIPLAFEPTATTFERNYPAAFTRERPLRVLFLGQINLRKGVMPLFEAAKMLRDEAVEFWFVGPRQVDMPKDVKIKYLGVAPRRDVDRYYRDADVFILPTLSDGFGLTQLEAQSWKLPVIASRNCGDVVTHNFNGLLLEEVSAAAIANALQHLLHAPEHLRTMSQNSGVNERFSLNSLATSLATL